MESKSPSGKLHQTSSANIPEGSEEGGVDGVSVVHVEVVPAALGGKVVEA